MFQSLTIHGATATLVWGYRTAAALRSWTIAQREGGWILTATLAQVDRFQCQQAATYKELLFEAPRPQGRWCWAIETLDVGPNHLRATLGQPLQ